MQITKYGYRFSCKGFRRHSVEVPARFDEKGNLLEKKYTSWKFKNPRNRSYHYCNSCHSFDWHYPRLKFSVTFSFCLTKVPSLFVQDFNRKLVGTMNDCVDPWTRVK